MPSIREQVSKIEGKLVSMMIMKMLKIVSMKKATNNGQGDCGDGGGRGLLWIGYSQFKIVA